MSKGLSIETVWQTQSPPSSFAAMCCGGGLCCCRSRCSRVKARGADVPIVMQRDDREAQTGMLSSHLNDITNDASCLGVCAVINVEATLCIDFSVHYFPVRGSYVVYPIEFRVLYCPARRILHELSPNSIRGSQNPGLTATIQR